MRLISLNTWGARVYEPLIKFIERESSETDIFCFQEVYHTIDLEHASTGGPEPRARADGHNQIIQTLGPDWHYYYSVGERGYNEIGRVDFHLEFGNLTCSRRRLPLLEQSEYFVHQDASMVETHDEWDQPRLIQLSSFDTFTLINFHGLWKRGTDKQDIPERFEQSRRLREIMDRYPKRLILVGDFNLLPDTQSISILERGMRNLIKEYSIASTRSSHYTKPIKFADYALVSPDIKVINFMVMPDEVSDHLPLMLEWN